MTQTSQLPTGKYRAEKESTVTSSADLWTADQCADYLAIKRNTWTSYVKRKAKNNPAPDPVKRIGRTPLWDPAEVRLFGANRSKYAPSRKGTPNS